MAIELPKIRILICDDDKDICEYMQTLLEKDGYIVKTISDPTKVEAEIRANEYHLLVVDLMMPKIHGIELVQRIRKIDTDVAVVVFTGFPTLDTALQAIKHNVDDYLKKPLNVDEFR